MFPSAVSAADGLISRTGLLFAGVLPPAFDAGCKHIAIPLGVTKGLALPALDGPTIRLEFRHPDAVVTESPETADVLDFYASLGDEE